MTREDGQIDWTEPAEVIERKIRAFDPWPGAFSQLADATGKSVQIENLSRNSQRIRSIGDPGTIFAPNDLEVLVATGRGALAPRGSAAGRKAPDERR